MRFGSILVILAAFWGDSVGLETTSERRVHRHKHMRKAEAKPLESLSQLMARSAELTKAFEKESAVLREKVQETEEIDAGEASSFIEKNHHSESSGLRAMESVTNEIMRFTDKMRKMGNEVSLFSSR